jgi:prevent-host-death family protein
MLRPHVVPVNLGTHDGDPLGALTIAESNRRGSASHMCYTAFMSRRITQRELRNESGRIMRALDKGEAFTVTRNGVPVGELVPVRPRVFVAAEAVAAAYRRAPRIARTRFRRDIDSAISQDPTPRG